MVTRLWVAVVLVVVVAISGVVQPLRSNQATHLTVDSNSPPQVSISSDKAIWRGTLLSTSLQRPLERSAVAVIGKTVYLFGGIGINVPSPGGSRAVFAFDAITETISNPANLSGPFWEMGASANGDVAYAVGGDSDSQTGWIWKLENGSLSENASLNYVIEAPAVAFGNGGLYVFGGGYKNCGTKHQTILRFDPATSRVTIEANSSLVQKCHMAAAFAEGHFYIFGGDHSLDVMRYDPRTASLTVLPVSLPRDIGESPQPASDGTLIYLLAGDEILIFDPRTESFHQTGPVLHKARQAAGLAWVTNRLYVLGGNIGGSSIASIVKLHPLNGQSPKASKEGASPSFKAVFVDLDPGDSHNATWEFGDGSSYIGIVAESSDGFSSNGTVLGSKVYGDNGNFTVTLTVCDDKGNCGSDSLVIAVNNVAPTIEDIEYHLNASFDFRIAGEKWHNVEIHLYEDGTEIGYANITRHPGSPNDQMVTLADFSINSSKTYSAVAYYSPENDPINGQIWGATPAWVILEYEDGEERIHHTFNVRHEDTWTWVINDFSPYFLGHNITFMATASDPGSDDLVFTWDWGDGNTTEHIHYNDGIGPDPCPSPEVNPITVTDIAKHGYAVAGTYTITLTVTDDDGGSATLVLTLTI